MAVLQDLLNNTGAAPTTVQRSYDVNVTQAPTSVRQAYAEWGISPSSIQKEMSSYGGAYGGNPNADVAIGSLAMRQPRVAPNPVVTPTISAPTSASTSPASNPLYDRLAGYFNETSAPAPQKSYEQIQQEELASIQDQLNAINAAYDQKVADARVRGEGRLGATRSLNTAAGLAFSPRGASATEETGQFNDKEIAAINADRAQEIAAARAAAMGIAFKRSESMADRETQAANDRVRNLLSAYQAMNEASSTGTNDALAIAKLTGLYNGQETLPLRELLAGLESQQYRDELAGRAQTLDERKYQSDLQLKIQDAQIAGKQIVQGDNGHILAVDKYTNQVTDLGNYAKPVASGGGYGGAGVNMADSTAREALALYFDTFGVVPDKADQALIVDRYRLATGGNMSPATNPYQSARDAQLGYKTAKATDPLDALINSALVPAGQ